MNKLNPYFYFWDESFRETSLRNPTKTKRKPKENKPFKKMTQSKVNEFLEEFIDELPEEFEKFSKEKLSRTHRIPQHQIAVALAYMNRIGKMSKPLHLPPHDNERERKLGLGYGGFGGWGQDIYIRNKKEQL